MSDKLQEIKERLDSNPHAFYGEVNYAGLGRMDFVSSDSARDDIHYLIQTIEQQQEEIENLTYLFKITQAKLEKLKESIWDPRKSNV